MSVFRRGAHSRSRFGASRNQRNTPNPYKKSVFGRANTMNLLSGGGAQKHAKDAEGALARKTYPVFAGIALAIFLVFTLALPQAYAAYEEIKKAAGDLSDYSVQGVSPNGTTIDLFDYWATNNGPSNDNYDLNQGINAGHQLKFNTGTSGELINSWTGKGKGPRTGMVMNTLQNGYPSLAKTTLSGWANTGGDGLDVFNQTVGRSPSRISSIRRARAANRVTLTCRACCRSILTVTITTMLLPLRRPKMEVGSIALTMRPSTQTLTPLRSMIRMP